MKGSVASLGLTAPQLHAYARDLYPKVKSWPPEELNRLCTELFASGVHEGGVLVAYLYRRFVKRCGAAELRMFGQWMERYAMSWAQVDGVGMWLIPASLANDPTLVPSMVKWTPAKSQWKRRAAAVGLLGEAKHGRHWDVIGEVVVRLANDPEDLVQKGVGWLLKEAYAATPAEVVALLRAEKFPRLVLRYAAEKMTDRDRRLVLA
jgi:3-methyladenine DNA glycosylase AlkD